MCSNKENDMPRLLNTTLTAAVAVLLSLGSIGAIIIVPPAQAESPVPFALPPVA